MEKLLERERELAAVQALLLRGGEVLLVEGGMGVGKTSLLDAASTRAVGLGHVVLRARGSELEADFAFGIVRQLFERRLATMDPGEREALIAGPATAVRRLLLGEALQASASDTTFAVLHGLYWLTVNLADHRPVLITVDDAHWGDQPSLRWLAHLVPRLDGLAVAVVVALRPFEAASAGTPLTALRADTETVVRPAALSEEAVATLVRAVLGDRATVSLSEALWEASAGNPLYVTEVLRAVQAQDPPVGELDPSKLLTGGREGIARRVLAQLRGLDPLAVRVAQALAVLGDGCELRHVSAIASVDMNDTIRLAAALVGIEVLDADDPPRFIHPVVRDVLEESLGGDQRDAGHRYAARLLDADGAPPGRVAAHLLAVRPAGDGWVFDRLRDSARAAMQSGAPPTAADLLKRALAEPPPLAQRVDVLREAARAEAAAGWESAFAPLEEALTLATQPRERAEIALEVAEAYAALFRWVEAVDVLERALSELGALDEQLAARLEGDLVICGLHDARRARRAMEVLERLASRSLAGGTAEPLAIGRGMAMVLTGGAAHEAAGHLEAALSDAQPRAENWDTRAALLWSLIVAERFGVVERALEPMVAEVHRSGSARGLVAMYSTLGLLNLRLGALPEADAAARVALRVLQEGDFGPGLAFAATVLADIAIEAGECDAAQDLLELLPQEGWPPGVGTVLIPAARGRLRLAQDRPAEALADFRTCIAMFDPELWGAEMRDVGYVHARSGAAMALLRLGERKRARELAEAELSDVVTFGAPRAIGVASRIAGLARGGDPGLEQLAESVETLRCSPAALELAHSLTELGAALRRAGRRAAAREPLSEALELAARCGARPLAARARVELKATGARPRREWRTGVESLTPSELRIVRLAGQGHTNREIAHELYVTLKTVEGHLSRAYTKLGIDGRDQLSGVLDVENTRVPTL